MPDYELVCVARPTIVDGLVLDWYADPGASGEIVSASRNGVMVWTLLHEVPAAVLAAANEAFEILRDGGPRELAAAMVTYRRRHRRGEIGLLERIPDDERPGATGR